MAVFAGDSGISHTDVIIDNEQFSLVATPPETSQLVTLQRNRILGQINLEDLSINLTRVGKLLHMAYFAAKGCGYGENMVELKMRIYDLGTGVTKLCSISSSTVANFRSSSYNVIRQLHAACQFLLDGFEEEAVDCLKSLKTTAKRMADEANNLKKKFEDKEKEVQDTLRKMIEVEDSRGVDQENIKKERVAFEEQIKVYKVKKQELKAKEEEAKTKKEYYEKKRDSEIEHFEEASLMKIIKRNIARSQDPRRERAEEWRKESIKHYEIEKEQRELYNTKLDQELVSITALRNCTDKIGDLVTAMRCLFTVTSALQHLANVMSDAVVFWERLDQECRDLSDSQMQKQVARGIEKDQEYRLKLWHSSGFKEGAVIYCSSWVALRSICHEYIDNLKSTQDKLKGYISENPTVEYAREMLPTLAGQLMNDTLQLKSANEKFILDADGKIQGIQKQKESNTDRDTGSSVDKNVESSVDKNEVPVAQASEGNEVIEDQGEEEHENKQEP